MLNYHEFVNLDGTIIDEDNENDNNNSLNHISNNENS